MIEETRTEHRLSTYYVPLWIIYHDLKGNKLAKTYITMNEIFWRLLKQQG